MALDQNLRPDWTVTDTAATLAVECRSSTFSVGTRTGGDFEDITRDLTRIGAETLRDISPKIHALENGETPIDLATTNSAKAVLCTFESFEPIALLGTMLDQKTKEIAGHPVEFHLVTIDYLENMCATEDPNVFMAALDALKVEDTWRDGSTADPMPAWESAIPDPIPQNPILNEAAEFILNIDVNAE